MTQPPARARVHAFGDDALGDHDATSLAAEIREGRVSRAEVVEAAIARAGAVDPTLGAIAAESFDRAREEADRPGTGFFAGIPTFIKDNTDVAGLPSQHGTAAFTARPAPTDGDFARTFFKLGPINLGKSQLSEFGISASAESPGRTVRNPWNPDHSS